MTGLSESRLAEIEAMVEAATEGPWHTAEEAGDLGSKYPPDFVANWEGGYLRGVGTVNTGDGDEAEADLRLMLEAPTVLPELLAEVRRLREVEAGRAAVRPGSRRDLLLAQILHEGGEWTLGRVKSFYAEKDFGHMYKATIRADLRMLTRAGHLVQHGGDGRRFYTAAAGGAQ